MHRYEPSTPRVTLGIAALAMTAFTVTVLVVMPSRIEAAGTAAGMLAASQVEARASDRAATDAAPVHEAGTVTHSCTSPDPSQKPAG